MVLHANFISCQVSFVPRCFYKSTLVVCAVARTVSRFVLFFFFLFWFHTLASKVHFRYSEGQTVYWSIMTADDSIKCRCVNSGTTGQVGGFQNRGVCLQEFPSFLPYPLPALLLAPFFPRSLTLAPRSLLLNRTETLAPFFPRSLTLVPRSLLLNRTETLATQAILWVKLCCGISLRICMESSVSKLFIKRCIWLN